MPHPFPVPAPFFMGTDVARIEHNLRNHHFSFFKRIELLPHEVYLVFNLALFFIFNNY